MNEEQKKQHELQRQRDLWGQLRSLASSPLEEGLELSDVKRALAVAWMLPRFTNPDERRSAVRVARSSLQRVGVDVRLFEVSMRWVSKYSAFDGDDHDRAYYSARAGFIGYFLDGGGGGGTMVPVWWDQETGEVWMCTSDYGTCTHCCAWNDARYCHGDAGVIWHAFNLSGQMQNVGTAPDLFGFVSVVKDGLQRFNREIGRGTEWCTEPDTFEDMLDWVDPCRGLMPSFDEMKQLFTDMPWQ